MERIVILPGDLPRTTGTAFRQILPYLGTYLGTWHLCPSALRPPELAPNHLIMDNGFLFVAFVHNSDMAVITSVR